MHLSDARVNVFEMADEKKLLVKHDGMWFKVLFVDKDMIKLTVRFTLEEVRVDPVPDKIDSEVEVALARRVMAEKWLMELLSEGRLEVYLAPQIRNRVTVEFHRVVAGGSTGSPGKPEMHVAQAETFDEAVFGVWRISR